ncbi:MAG: hypothetical protein JWM80_1353 [Cyanobacteria bacterium RYN_339]|nr:hypothetical protein [Cyanobacteria bacterium RYN_339]
MRLVYPADPSGYEGETRDRAREEDPVANEIPRLPSQTARLGETPRPVNPPAQGTGPLPVPKRDPQAPAIGGLPINAALGARQGGHADIEGLQLPAISMHHVDTPTQLDQLIAGQHPPSPELLRAKAGVDYLTRLDAALGGPPATRVQSMASLLADGAGFAEAIRSLGPLKGSPLLGALRAATQRLTAEATPAALANELNTHPDTLGDPGAAEAVARLRPQAPPELAQATDAAALQLLDRPGGVSLQEVRQHPEMGRLLAGLQQSPDPAVRAKVEATVRQWANTSMEQHLTGREGESAVKAGVKEFQAEMVELGNSCGLGPTVAQIGPEVVKGHQQQIEKQVKAGMSWFERTLHNIGDFLGDVLSGLGSALNWVCDKAGAVVETVVDVAGKVITAPLDLAADVMDGLGMDGAADGLRKVDAKVRDGFDWAGNQLHQVTKGAGAGLSGTLDGLSMVVRHPVDTVEALASLVTHPEKLVEVGKAMWKEISEHGVAYGLGYVTSIVVPMLISGGSTSISNELSTAMKASKFVPLKWGGEVLTFAREVPAKFLEPVERTLVKVPGVKLAMEGIEQISERGSKMFEGVNRVRTQSVQTLRRAFGRTEKVVAPTLEKTTQEAVTIVEGKLTREFTKKVKQTAQKNVIDHAKEQVIEQLKQQVLDDTQQMAEDEAGKNVLKQAVNQFTGKLPT